MLKVALRGIEKPSVFWAVTLLLLGVMGALLFTSSVQETNTWDEPAHLAAGYVYLRTGNFWYDQVHAPLARMLLALPLLAVNPRLPLEDDSWRTYDIHAFSKIFLYRNRVRPDTLLLLGRLSAMALTLVLGLVLAVWTRKHFGPGAALFALFLYALDPNIIAHGRYTTTDLIAGLFIFLSCIGWARFLETKRWLDLAGAGVVLGLALASKHSAVFLLGLLPLLSLIRWRQDPGRLPLRRLAVSLVVVAGLALTVVAAVYWPVSVKVFIAGEGRPLSQEVDPTTAVGRAFQRAGDMLHLPNHPYLMGYYWLARANEQGFSSYLLGEHSRKGWWYFFPVVFAVKTPTALLLGLAFSIAVAGWRLIRRSPRRSLRETPFCRIVAALPAAVYFLLSMTSDINMGWRHLLPVYPFLFVLVSAVLARKSAVPVLLLLAGLQVYENARVYPHYLAFFNSLAGGSENGPRYLVDSNLDWGQDVKKLKVYMDRNGIDEVCLAYFGTADVDYYGIRHRDLPRTSDKEGRKNVNCVAVISATLLQDVYTAPGSYEWLRQLEPIERIGYSIYVYDLRKDPSGQP